MQTVQEQILEKLDSIEQEHMIRIPLAVESGSRAWGFASPDSDYDCRFVYVSPVAEYLTVFERKDTIEYTPDAVFDVSGWDIRKFLEHLVKSNAVMLEWLQSGIQYRKNDAVWLELWRLGRAFFCPVKTSWHYLSMARNKLAEIMSNDTAKIKRYFYVMRPLACVRFIREHGEIPYMEYRRNLAEVHMQDDILAEIDALLARKKCTKEAQEIAANEALLAYFAKEIALAEDWLSSRSKRQSENTKLADQCFRRVLEIMYAYT